MALFTALADGRGTPFPLPIASHGIPRLDVLIVGSGLAGLSAALHLAPTHRVAVITKRALQDGASGWAQGGIAAVLADDDSFAADIEDTLVAGGTRFMPEHDARAELAPRDVVARAIDYEMKRHGLDCVHLDISHQSPEFLHEHFPNILAHCASLGIDITKESIPVVPTAHFTCGGVLTDLAGRTDLPWAKWPAPACTTPTGWRAIRCSNVWCLRAPQRRPLPPHPLRRCPTYPPGTTAACRTPMSRSSSRTTGTSCAVSCGTTWASCAPTSAWSALLQGEIQEFYAHFHVTRDLLELRNLVQVADLIVRSAQMRRKSRGLHYSRDYPEMAAPAAPTILVPPVQ